jgi:hypothetical protein
LSVYTRGVRRLIPFSILGVLVIVSIAAIAVSNAQSHASVGGVSMLESCSNKLGQRPTTYVVFCADANGEFTNLTWQDWGDATAYATGIARWNDCTPNCASGKWKSEPVTLWAWRIRGHLYTQLSSSDQQLLATMTVQGYPG